MLILHDTVAGHMETGLSAISLGKYGTPENIQMTKKVNK